MNNPYEDDPSGEHNQEQWGIASDKFKLSPLYNANSLMEFMVEQQARGRKHNSVKK